MENKETKEEGVTCVKCSEMYFEENCNPCSFCGESVCDDCYGDCSCDYEDIHIELKIKYENLEQENEKLRKIVRNMRIRFGTQTKTKFDVKK